MCVRALASENFLTSSGDEDDVIKGFSIFLKYTAIFHKRTSTCSRVDFTIKIHVG